MPVLVRCDKFGLHRTVTLSNNLDLRNAGKGRIYEMGHRVVWFMCAALNVDLGPTDRVMVKTENLIEVALKGQHLAVRCGRMKSDPWHHGIYGGFDEEGRGWVYHIAGLDKRTARIRKDPFLSFVRGQQEVAIVIYADDTPANRKKHVDVACHLYDHGPAEHLYDLFRFNCEHFAVLCKTGR